MAYIVTPVFGMKLADPATVQQFETTVVNDNFLALEDGILVERARITAAVADITTLQGKPSFNSQVTNFEVLDPAALDALTTAAIGDTAVMTTPGTGINMVEWRAVAGAGATIDWVPSSPIIADTKAHLDTFIGVVAALTADVKFEIGGFAFITAGSGRLYQFTSAAGALRATEAMVPIIPSSVVGTGVVLGANGVVTGTAVATSFSINGCFTTEFDQYLVIFEGTNPVGSTITGRLRASGTDSSAGYDKNVLYTSESGASGASLEANLAQWPMSLYGLPLNRLLKFDFHGPALAVGTKVITDYNETNNAGAIARSVASLYHRTTSAFDGVTFFLTASSHTFTVRIFGYNKN